MSDHPSAVSGAFQRPFTEQIAFFRSKLGNQVPTQAWDDLKRSEHDSAFMVAGAAKADLLSDLAAAVDKAISEGRGLEEFRADFRDIVRRNGWTGWTGEGSVRGEAWRVRTILTTNAMTSYAAGRLAQLKAGNFPIWVYRHGGSQEPRPQHLDWDGLMLNPAHLFWRTHYPPSDWGCSCYVLGASSERAAKRLGGKPGKTLPKDWQAIDPKTGAPVGIGKNWDYAPGDSVSEKVQALAAKVGSWDNRIATAFLEELPAETSDQLSRAYRALPSTRDDLRRYAQRVFDRTDAGTEDMAPVQPTRTLGMARSGHVAQINEALGTEAIRKTGFDFAIDRNGTRHIRSEHGPSGKSAITITPVDFALLPELVEQPDAILSGGDEHKGLPRALFRKTIAGKVYEAVFELRGGTRTLMLKTFYVVKYAR
ncbi:phage head protein [Aurantiacibacter xanthus]|uniref:Phage head protein n=1 Tax=Aurantiacibacter xanthus TaxID=1784712 RepID=A0A3A1P323_9SPHN|nr:phage minor head protein [Aurantiacibacter xanthus]RIV82960.1 phage head protein [Aurantiacibacter xanthus]